VVGDEAFIHYVEEDTRQRVDQRTYNCWAVCKDPSRLSQMVYLSMASYEAQDRNIAQAHFVMPSSVKNAHVF
jgi:hypothetical protein